MLMENILIDTVMNQLRFSKSKFSVQTGKDFTVNLINILKIETRF